MNVDFARLSNQVPNSGLNASSASPVVGRETANIAARNRQHKSRFTEVPLPPRAVANRSGGVNMRFGEEGRNEGPRRGLALATRKAQQIPIESLHMSDEQAVRCAAVHFELRTRNQLRNATTCGVELAGQICVAMND